MSVCVFLKVNKFSPQRQNSRHSQSNCWSCSPVLCLYRPAWTTAELKPRHVRSTTRWYQYPLWCQCPPLRNIKTTLPRRCLKTGLGRSFYSFPFRDLFFVCFSFDFTSVQCSKSLKSSGYNFLVESSVLFSHSSAHCSHWRKASQGQILLAQHVLWRETQCVSRAATCRKYSE